MSAKFVQETEPVFQAYQAYRANLDGAVQPSAETYSDPLFSIATTVSEAASETDRSYSSAGQALPTVSGDAPTPTYTDVPVAEPPVQADLALEAASGPDATNPTDGPLYISVDSAGGLTASGTVLPEGSILPIKDYVLGAPQALPASYSSAPAQTHTDVPVPAEPSPQADPLSDTASAGAADGVTPVESEATGGNGDAPLSAAPDAAPAADADGVASVAETLEELSAEEASAPIVGDAGDIIPTTTATVQSIVNDTVDFSTSTEAVLVDLVLHIARGGGAQESAFSGTTHVIGSSFRDQLTGNTTIVSFDGGDGDDFLLGGGNNNIFIGGQGADTIIGGGGGDTASYATSGAAVTVNLGDNSQNAGGDADGDFLISVTNLEGSLYNDTLTGDGAANSLYGGAGDDVLEGGAGADALEGGGGSDTASYAGSAAAVTVNLSQKLAQGGDAEGDTLSGITNLNGSAFNDGLTGNDNANLLNGGTGDDILQGGGGADILVGGGGTDTTSYAGSAAAVSVNLATNVNHGGDAEGDALTGIAAITGSVFNDTLAGDGGTNTLDGGAGDDVLAGGAGADTLVGGGGIDTADYSASSAGTQVDLSGKVANLGGDAQGDTLIGIANLVGSANNDYLAGNSATNILYGGLGNDILIGGTGADKLYGGTGDDIISFDVDDTLINGGTGYNTANVADGRGVSLDLAAAAITEANGNGGNDILDGRNVSFYVRITGGAGDDIVWASQTYSYLDGGTGNDTLYGGAGNDTVFAGTGADKLYGGDGNDILHVDSSDTAIDGGKGYDSIYIDDNKGGRYTLTNARIEEVHAGSGGDYIDNSNGARIVVYGGIGSDTIIGGTGNDILLGGAGDDVLAGGVGGDALTGGGGNDTVSYAASGAAVTVNLVTNVNSGGDAQSDFLTGISNLVGSTFNDTLTGTAGSNILNGGAGDDILVGGAGVDSLIGGGGNDTASYAGSAAAVLINLATASIHGGDAEGDIYAGIINLIGSSFNDTLTGDANANVLNGSLGDDRVFGTGNDLLIGGGGNDYLQGQSGSNDLVDYSRDIGATDKVTLTLDGFNDLAHANVTRGGIAETDSIAQVTRFAGGVGNADTIGFANNTFLFGTIDLAQGAYSGFYVYGDGQVAANSGSHSGFENITVGDGSFTLIGNAGANIFQVGQGVNTLTGGAGSDTFRFESLAPSQFGYNNTITDFQVGTTGDVLNIHDLLVSDTTYHAGDSLSLYARIAFVNNNETLQLNIDAVHAAPLGLSAGWQDVAIFQNLTVSLATLEANHQIIT
ncbi:MAG TPA: type I secretion C-terminal target domain-containing protein [Dongiaceae bacterium]|jgi:Ca2+-binding RTX toxin-like protein|nr:type I secretion C-terminal target domain-containing protein [Dongiaceae bacterium]